MKNNLQTKVCRALFCLTTILFSTSLKAQEPTLEWARSFGGTSLDFGFDVEVDLYGNVYTTGYFSETVDFDPGTGIYNLTSSGLEDIFISKLDSNGNFIWARALGGASTDYGLDIAIDNLGNVLATGSFTETADFDPGSGTFNLESVGSADLFISRLDANGDFLWAKSLGNSYIDDGTSIAIDIDDNIFVKGNFQGTVDFDPGIGTAFLTSSYNNSVYILKLDADGNFIWAKNIGGTSGYGGTLGFDSLGNIYIVGTYTGIADFDPGEDIFNLTASSELNAFVTKLDDSGNFVWAKSMGGLSIAYGRGLTVDLLGNVYLTGYFSGNGDFDPGSETLILNSFDIGPNMFILKLNTLGELEWAKNLGGTEYALGFTVTLDPLQNIYVSGFFYGTTDFDPGDATYNLSSNAGNDDFFTLKLDNDGNFIWARNTGGSQNWGNSIKIDGSNNIYTTGFFNATTDFDPNIGVTDLVTVGYTDIFIQKLNQIEATGLAESNGRINYSIYPNPSKGIFTIDITNKAEITITNILGEVILTKTLLAGKQTLTLQNQPNGIYLAKIVSENGQQIVKLIKE